MMRYLYLHPPSESLFMSNCLKFWMPIRFKIYAHCALNTVSFQISIGNRVLVTWTSIFFCDIHNNFFFKWKIWKLLVPLENDQSNRSKCRSLSNFMIILLYVWLRAKKNVILFRCGKNRKIKNGYWMQSI